MRTTLTRTCLYLYSSFVFTGAFQLSMLPHSNSLRRKSSHKPSCTGISNFITLRMAHDEQNGSLRKKPFSMETKWFQISCVLSAIAWITLSIKALSHHPDPRFINCSIQHNVLTMGQAMAFPLPVFMGTVQALSRASTRWMSVALGTGLGATMVYTALSTAFARSFAFGYDLYPLCLKAVATFSFLWTSKLCFLVSAGAARDYQTSFNSQSQTQEERRQLLTFISFGMACCFFNPLLSGYPAATVPAILGKRLSRPAAGFWLLGSVATACLARSKDVEANRMLRRGLAWGSLFHVSLILLKLIGLDDGGLLLPGRGLWELYPAMLAVPLRASLSAIVHCMMILATTY